MRGFIPVCEERMHQKNNKKERAKKIIEGYFSSDLSPEVEEIIQGWIVGEDSEDGWGEVLEMLFCEEVTKAERPDKNTIRSLKQIQKRLGWIKPVPLRRKLLRVAAAFIPALLIVGGYVWYENQKPSEKDFVAVYEISVPVNERKHIVLDDGTEVDVNSASEFSYDGDRECTLKGEGYFKVAKSDKPFIVRTNHTVVTVLGTEFNLSEQEDNGLSVVTLYSGSVKVGYESGMQILEPGMEFTYNSRDDQVHVTRFDPDAGKPLWINEGKVSQLYSLGEIFRMIESEYGVVIENKHIPDTNAQYTFRLETADSIDMIMSALRIASGDFNYRIEANRIIIEQQ